MKKKTIKAWAVVKNGKISTLNGFKKPGIYLITDKKNFFSKKELSDWAEITSCEIKLLK